MDPTGRDPSYRALLVANWTFPADTRLVPLVGPENDVRLLQEALSDDDVGLFEPAHVQILGDLSIVELMPAVEEFFADATSLDTRLFYYSGHGRLDQRDELFLCNRTTRIDRPFATALKSSDLRNLIERSPATCIVILDCCYSGKFKGGATPRQLTARGSFAITASRAHELAEDAHGPDHTSLFTRHLLDGLRDLELPGREGFLSLEDLYAAIDQAMHDEGGQQPQKSFRGAGIPHIARRPLVVVPPPPEPLRLSTDRIDLGVIDHDEQLPPERVDVIGVETDTDWEVEASASWIEVSRQAGHIVVALYPVTGLNRANVLVRDLRTRNVGTIRIRVERRPPVVRNPISPSAPSRPPPLTLPLEDRATSKSSVGERPDRATAIRPAKLPKPTAPFWSAAPSGAPAPRSKAPPDALVRLPSSSLAKRRVGGGFLSDDWVDAFIEYRNSRPSKSPTGTWQLVIEDLVSLSLCFQTRGGVIVRWQREPPSDETYQWQAISRQDLWDVLTGETRRSDGSAVQAFAGSVPDRSPRALTRMTTLPPDVWERPPPRWGPTDVLALVVAVLFLAFGTAAMAVDIWTRAGAALSISFVTVGIAAGLFWFGHRRWQQSRSARVW